MLYLSLGEDYLHGRDDAIRGHRCEVVVIVACSCTIVSGCSFWRPGGRHPFLEFLALWAVSAQHRVHWRSVFEAIWPLAISRSRWHSCHIITARGVDVWQMHMRWRSTIYGLAVRAGGREVMDWQSPSDTILSIVLYTKLCSAKNGRKAGDRGWRKGEREGVALRRRGGEGRRALMWVGYISVRHSLSRVPRSLPASAALGGDVSSPARVGGSSATGTQHAEA